MIIEHSRRISTEAEMDVRKSVTGIKSGARHRFNNNKPLFLSMIAIELNSHDTAVQNLLRKMLKVFLYELQN